jgi:hypothetical protein
MRAGVLEGGLEPARGLSPLAAFQAAALQFQ